MGEISKSVGQWIAQNVPLSVGIAVFILLELFDISKVKIYPLRWLWKLIAWPFKKINQKRKAYIKDLFTGLTSDIDVKLNDINTSFESKLNTMATAQGNNCADVKACFTELEKRFDKLDERQQQTEEKLDSLAAARIKNHVLNFARQCRTGVPHSHEDFSNLFAESKTYEELVKKYGWENDVYKHDFAYIQRVYDECNVNNSFLG